MADISRNLLRGRYHLRESSTRLGLSGTGGYLA